jgi:hypothetical protein
MTTFAEIKVILDRLVNGEEIRMHGAFWRGTTRDEFVALNIFGLSCGSMAPMTKP